MKINKERLTYLYRQYQEDKLNVAEELEWESAVAASSSEKDLLSVIGEDWEIENFKAPELHEEEREQILAYVMNQTQTRVQNRKLWSVVVVAAAVTVMIFGVGFFFYRNSKPANQLTVDYVYDVVPGKPGATLTLANGKKIKLNEASEGELAEEGGVVISKSYNGELEYTIIGGSAESDKFNTLSTANGETFKLRLPDGSLVWLNSASSLTYTSSLMKNGKRSVRLSGEGYFEVAKDKQHPFVVKTDKQEVEVLGTHFNINSYIDEPATATTLLEGSVKVIGAGSHKIIKPGEQALSTGVSLNVTKVDPQSVTDWKEGDFNLERIYFKTAMRKIARWYDVEVVYMENVPVDFEMVGWLSRNKNLSEVLKFIETIDMVRFKIEGKRVYVSKK